jgi:TetR/AcrR family transcriptional repressor of nem operon
MNNSTAVRDRLLRQGLDLFRERGYHATGIQQIADAANIPKGSFCYYFKSKEAFAFCAIEHYAADIEAGIQAFFDKRDLAPLVRLRAYFEDALASMKAADTSHGCAIGNLLAEISETNDVLQGALHAAWERLVGGLQAFLAEAQQAGTLSEKTDLHRLAELLLSGWEGALIAMRARQDTQPIEDFLSYVFDPLLADGSAPPRPRL